MERCNSFNPPSRESGDEQIEKTKTPKIHPCVMTRPRLDALFERQARGVKPVTTPSSTRRRYGLLPAGEYTLYARY